jgi:hypothetical protein
MISKFSRDIGVEIFFGKKKYENTIAQQKDVKWKTPLFIFI